MNSQTTIRAQYIRTIYQDNDDICKIAVFMRIDANGKNQGEVRILGQDLPMMPNVTYQFNGHMEEHSQYGRQFRASDYVQDVGSNEREIVDYLSSLDGCGRKTAQKIYDAFGNETFRILDIDSQRLSSVKGISSKKASIIKASWDSNQNVAAIYKLLAPYGVTVTLASKAYKRFSDQTEDLIEHHPYDLAMIHGITFEMMDAVAFDKGIDINDADRISCAAWDVLTANESDGHLGMLPDDFTQAMSVKLNSGRYPMIGNNVLSTAINDLLFTNYMMFTSVGRPAGGCYIYRMCTREVELVVANAIQRHMCKIRPPENLRQMIIEEFRIADMKPDPSQIKAVETVFCNRLSIITGGPGTGKTTIICIIKAIYRRLNPDGEICFLAPTGRAARRLSDSVGAKASTIHSRLKMYGDEDGDEMQTQDTIQEGMVVLDEASMTDIWTARALLSATNTSSRMVFVGDPAQLQSVGAGAFFRDMIDSGCIPVASLNCIYRQALNSAIILNAQKIENGNINLCAGSDFEIHDHLQGDNLYKAMARAYIQDARIYGIMQTVCLVPTRKEVADMNQRIQALINPAAGDMSELKSGGQLFRVGDLVMELTNTETVVNGDIGTITNVDPINRIVTVHYDNKYIVVYEKKELERITLAYAMTVHKAQGSEYASVITCLQDCNGYMKVRSLVYTAITRAKTICRFYGSYQALQVAAQTDDSTRRQTLLAQDIRAQVEQMAVAV